MHQTFTYGLLSKAPFGSRITEEWNFDWIRPPNFIQMTRKDLAVWHMLQDFMIRPNNCLLVSNETVNWCSWPMILTE